MEGYYTTVRQIYNEYVTVKDDGISDPATFEFNKRGLALFGLLDLYAKGKITKRNFIRYRKLFDAMFSDTFPDLVHFIREVQDLNRLADYASCKHSDDNIERDIVKATIRNIAYVSIEECL
jgi:hypothetical protein